MSEQERGEESTEGAPSAGEVGGTQPQAGGPAAPGAEAAPPPAGATPEAIAAEGEPAAAKSPVTKPDRPAKAEAKAPPAKVPAPAGSIADTIREALPDVTFEAFQGLTDIIVEISRDDVPKMLPVLKSDPRLDMKFLRSLSGIDHLDEGMEVVYHLLSLEKNQEVVVKARIPKEDLRVASMADVWQAANWHEREARDMFGIQFEGHPHLVPLLLPEDMTDHFPLRKDIALQPIEEWQGERVGEDVSQVGHIPTGSAFEGVASTEGEE